MKTSERPILPEFSLHSDLNAWIIKNRDATSKTYNIGNSQLDIYADVPYDAIPAFPSSEHHHQKITEETLVSENTKFRQELYFKNTELQELQMNSETLQMENNGKEKTTSDNYWRRQYFLTEQMQKTGVSNLKQINKAFAQ